MFARLEGNAIEIVGFKMKYKEIYCQDCKTVLAKYNDCCFTDSNIFELARIHYHSHIKSGHSLIIRIAD